MTIMFERSESQVTCSGFVASNVDVEKLYVFVIEIRVYGPGILREERAARRRYGEGEY